MKSAAKKDVIEFDFGKALRFARVAKGVPQEAFDQVSSRTYVSSLERGIKQPTVGKVNELAAVLELHPVTLLALAYLLPHPTSSSTLKFLETLSAEIDELLLQTK